MALLSKSYIFESQTSLISPVHPAWYTLTSKSLIKLNQLINSKIVVILIVQIMFITYFKFSNLFDFYST